MFFRRCRRHAPVTNKTSAILLLTGNIRLMNVQRATPPRQKNQQKNNDNVVQKFVHLGKKRKQTIQICSHRQAVNTARRKGKHARTAWCPPLTHHARRGSHVKQLQGAAAEESTFPLSAAPPAWQRSGSESAHCLFLVDRLAAQNFVEWDWS